MAYMTQVGFFGVQVVLVICFDSLSILSVVHIPAACVLRPESFQSLVSHFCPGAVTSLAEAWVFFPRAACACVQCWHQHGGFPLSSICSVYCLQTFVLDPLTHGRWRRV